MDCDFSSPDAICHTCKYKGRPGLRKNCKGSPGIVRKAWSMTGATVRWIKAGRPRRTAEQVAEVFAICKACPEFQPRDDGNGSCGLCGCPLRQGGGVIDKISMATEGCPAEPSRWLPAQS